MALAVAFAAWYCSEHILSIHTITITRREDIYWAAILCTLALGTAAGNLTGEQLQLGYSLSALLFAALIALTAAAYYVLQATAILTFWIVYILTRALGASCGDLLSQPSASGGLGLGTTGTSAQFLVVIAGLLAWLTHQDRAAPAGA